MANTFKTPLQKAAVTWLTTNSVTIAELSRRSEIDKGDLSKINSGLKGSLNMESAAKLAGPWAPRSRGYLAAIRQRQHRLLPRRTTFTWIRRRSRPVRNL